MREQDAWVKVPESLAKLEVLAVSSMYSISLEWYVRAIKQF